MGLPAEDQRSSIPVSQENSNSKMTNKVEKKRQGKG